MFYLFQIYIGVATCFLSNSVRSNRQLEVATRIELLERYTINLNDILKSSNDEYLKKVNIKVTLLKNTDNLCYFLVGKSSLFRIIDCSADTNFKSIIEQDKNFNLSLLSHVFKDIPNSQKTIQQFFVFDDLDAEESKLLLNRIINIVKDIDEIDSFNNLQVYNTHQLYIGIFILSCSTIIFLFVAVISLLTLTIYKKHTLEVENVVNQLAPTDIMFPKVVRKKSETTGLGNMFDNLSNVFNNETSDLEDQWMKGTKSETTGKRRKRRKRRSKKSNIEPCELMSTFIVPLHTDEVI